MRPCPRHQRTLRWESESWHGFRKARNVLSDTINDGCRSSCTPCDDEANQVLSAVGQERLGERSREWHHAGA